MQSWRCLRTAWRGAAVLVLLATGLPGAAASPPSGHAYEAVLDQPALVGGVFMAGGQRWSCMGTLRRCQARLPEPQPTLQACQALAARVGALRAFGRVGGAVLDEQALADCNRQARPQPPQPSARARPG